MYELKKEGYTEDANFILWKKDGEKHSTEKVRGGEWTARNIIS